MVASPQYQSDNIFAKILEGKMPCHKVFEDEHTFVFMDIMPRSIGHALVIPKASARNLFDLDPALLGPLQKTVQRVAKASMNAFDADGITIQQFNEQAGGQVVFHLHVHVIPRFTGVELAPHTGQMEDSEVLAKNAEKLTAALS